MLTVTCISYNRTHNEDKCKYIQTSLLGQQYSLSLSHLMSSLSILPVYSISSKFCLFFADSLEFSKIVKSLESNHLFSIILGTPNFWFKYFMLSFEVKWMHNSSNWSNHCLLTKYLKIVYFIKDYEITYSKISLF